MKQERKVQVLMVAPGQHPVAVRIPCSRTAFEAAVNAGENNFGVTRVKKLEDGVYILYCDKGVPFEEDGNRRIAGTIMTGVFCVIAADACGNVISLPSAVLQKYKALLWEPEYFSYEELVEAYLADFYRGLDEIVLSASIN